MTWSILSCVLTVIMDKIHQGHGMDSLLHSWVVLLHLSGPSLGEGRGFLGQVMLVLGAVTAEACTGVGTI